jgi:hypothetical protein
MLLAILMLAPAVPARHAAAQTTGGSTGSGGSTGNLTSTVFDTSDFPLWAKDLRRWEIVAFGTFPFTMFAATFAMDTRRWIDQNSMDFSEDGRRYAPWPFKSAGAVDMTNKEHETTLLVAAGISVALAFADLIIVQIKRHKERQRAESLPAGTIIIDKSPWPETPNDNANSAGTGGGQPEAANPAAP